MGLTGKGGSENGNSVSSSENWGMGFLFVFFPEENPAAIVDKDKLFSSSPPSSSFSSSSPSSSSIRRNSSNLLLARAQSTISICALLVFISLLLFTLSTFEPTIPAIKAQSSPARRFLSHKLSIRDDVNSTVGINPQIHRNSVIRSSWFAKMWKQKVVPAEPNRISATALQGMGNLYRRGTRAMHDLLVCHVVEETTADEFRLYLRMLHRSGITSKSDTVFIFPSQSLSSRFNSIIQEENDWFLKLIGHYQKLNSTSRRTESGFDPTPFLAVGKKEKEAREPLWGKKLQTNASGSDHTESTRLSYGSVVSFEAADLDPENSLAGFSDHVRMNLRRWACYPLLLGRLRRNFKHVILVEVKNTFLFGDPLGRVRNKTPESVYIYRKPEQLPSKHSRKNSERARQQTPSNPAILMGGSRGIRRLSNVMLTAIVQTLMQPKKKGPVSESEILSQLAGNELNAKNIDFIRSSEAVPELNPAAVRSSKSSTLFTPAAEFTVARRGNINFDEFSHGIRKKICSSEVDSHVYSSDCDCDCDGEPKNPQK